MTFQEYSWFQTNSTDGSEKGNIVFKVLNFHSNMQVLKVKVEPDINDLPVRMHYILFTQ